MYDSRVAEVGKQGKDVSKSCVQVDIPEHSVAGIYKSYGKPDFNPAVGGKGGSPKCEETKLEGDCVDTRAGVRE